MIENYYSNLSRIGAGDYVSIEANQSEKDCFDLYQILRAGIYNQNSKLYFLFFGDFLKEYSYLGFTKNVFCDDILSKHVKLCFNQVLERNEIVVYFHIKLHFNTDYWVFWKYETEWTNIGFKVHFKFTNNSKKVIIY